MTPPKVTARDLECPSCESPAGISCANRDGRRLANYHPRRLKAAREHNAEQFPAHVRGQLDIFGREVSA